MSDALLYSVAEAAQRLSISESTCYELIQAGKLRVVRIPPGGRMRVPAIALDEFVRSLETDVERAV